MNIDLFMQHKDNYLHFKLRAFSSLQQSAGGESLLSRHTDLTSVLNNKELKFN